MKLRKVRSSKAFKFGWRITIAALILSALAYGLIKISMSAMSSRSDMPLPSVVINANRSLSTQIYFNNVVGQKGSLDILRAQIDKAEHSIEIAVFTFASSDLKNAIYRAAKRGVRVTLVLNRSNTVEHDLFLSDLPSSIKRIDAGTYDPNVSRNTTYMHDKFMIIDRGSASEVMTTGSLNFTSLGEQYNQSFLLVTTDHDIIATYGKEFDLLKETIFGIKKLGNVAYDPWAATINYTDSFLEIWFSPGFSSQSIKFKILKHINAAKKNIDIMMWDLTDREIAAALVKKVKEGVKIRILTEVKTAESRDSSIPYLRSAKEKNGLDAMEIILDTKLGDQSKNDLPNDFTPYIHHHSMLVDGAILVVGSGNWTIWGFYNNDENALITDNAYLIKEWQTTFEHFYNTLK